jgi:hypothetical protein
MGFFKKKSESLPELPELPNQDNYAQQNEKYFSLPQMPESSMGNQITQNTIKEEVSQTTQPPIPQISEIPKKQKNTEKEIIDSYSKNSYLTREIETPKKRYIENTVKKRTRNSEPLFVQIDKFESTVSSFDEIKLKVSELESLLKSIKELKAKEEQDLNEWEAEINQIKSQLDNIDKEIFSEI